MLHSALLQIEQSGACKPNEFNKPNEDKASQHLEGVVNP